MEFTAKQKYLQIKITASNLFPKATHYSVHQTSSFFGVVEILLVFSYLHLQHMLQSL